MNTWLQHGLVLAGVAVCVGVVGWQVVRTLSVRGGGKIGACCAKGCQTRNPVDESKRPATTVQFLPLEMLSRKR